MLETEGGVCELLEGRSQVDLALERYDDAVMDAGIFKCGYDTDVERVMGTARTGLLRHTVALDEVTESMLTASGEMSRQANQRLVEARICVQGRMQRFGEMLIGLHPVQDFPEGPRLFLAGKLFEVCSNTLVDGDRVVYGVTQKALDFLNAKTGAMSSEKRKQFGFRVASPEDVKDFVNRWDQVNGRSS